MESGESKNLSFTKVKTKFSGCAMMCQRLGSAALEKLTHATETIQEYSECVDTGSHLNDHT